MTCCCSTVGNAVDRQFSAKRATNDLARYRAKGPGSTTRLVIHRSGFKRLSRGCTRNLVRGRVREVVTRRTEDLSGGTLYAQRPPNSCDAK